ncbi:hypothetical protein [Polymorphobacter sp.]|uniref:hypothetical protein n=1 Tax=Polymorphobacter sp. TaxID=1909290 RepID=UPI003F7260F3
MTTATKSMPVSAKRRLDINGQQAFEDRTMAMIAALAAELAVTRERLDTVERLLADAGGLDRSAIEAYQADKVATAERDAIRKRLIGRVFNPLRADAARQQEKG